MTAAAHSPGNLQPGQRPLLAAKLVAPTPRLTIIQRRRLFERLDAATRRPLTVINACAGAGKTVLASSWSYSGRPPGPVAWLRLEDSDNDPGTFWSYVAAALRRVGVGVPDGLPPRGDQARGAFLAWLANELSGRTKPVVLTLDETDRVADEEIQVELNRLVRNADPGLRLILLSRSAERIPLHRFRISGEVTEIDSAELAFTREETHVLLRGCGLRLTRAECDALLEETQGWAAALRLALNALRAGDDPETLIGSLAGQPALRGYLNDLLAAHGPQIRRFMLLTSVVGELTPDLADAVAERANSEQMLNTLVARNLLTEQPSERPGWFRYHPLLAERLRSELRGGQPAVMREVRGRASLWFEQHGMLTAAAAQAIANDDWPLACRIVIRGLAVGELLHGAHGTALARLMHQLPETIFEPAAAVVRAALAIGRYDSESCARMLRVIEARAETDRRAGSAAEDRALRASIAVVRSAQLRATGASVAPDGLGRELDRAVAPQVAAPDSTAPDAASADSGAVEALRSRAALLMNLGAVQMWGGEFDAARGTVRTGVRLARHGRCRYSSAYGLSLMALLELIAGRLRRSGKLAREAEQRFRATGLEHNGDCALAQVVRAYVALAQNDRTAYRRHLDEAERCAGASRDPLTTTMIMLLRARKYLAAQQHRRGLALLITARDHAARFGLPDWLAAQIAMTEASVHVRRGDPAGALQLLGRAQQRTPRLLTIRATIALGMGDRSTMAAATAEVLDSPSAGDIYHAEAWLTRCRARVEDGNLASARDALRRALSSAERERYRYPFCTAGRWLRVLLDNSPDVAAAHQWLGLPLVDGAKVARPRMEPVAGPRSLPRPLTEREHAVLRRMARAESTEDIAEALFVSANTVKTHQKSIHRKLSVTRRFDAVRRGRELGLI